MESKNNKTVDRKRLSRRFFLQKCGVGAIAVSSGGIMSGCASKPKINFSREIHQLNETPGREAENRSYIDAYLFENCVECGSCLEGCLYREYSQADAVRAIKDLRNGKNCEKILNNCVLCMKCNHRCPEDARPAALLLERLSDIRKREGTPTSLTYMKNGLQKKGHRKNFWTDYQKSFTPKEKRILYEWAEPKKGEDLLYCGCGPRLFPRQFGESRALSGIPKFGGISDCCGYFSFRSGAFDEARYIVNNLIDNFSKCQFNRLVTSCGACQRQLSMLFPEYIGQAFPFEIISLYEWLDEKMQDGTLTIKRQVDFDCAFSECCNSYDLNDNYKNSVKRLTRAIGLSPSQLDHHGKDNACCGGGAFLNDGKAWDVMQARSIKHRDLKNSGKKHILSSCQGCYATIRFLHLKRSHFLLDNILWALGDDEMEYYLGPRRVFNPSMAVGFLQSGPSVVL